MQNDYVNLKLYSGYKLDPKSPIFACTIGFSKKKEKKREEETDNESKEKAALQKEKQAKKEEDEKRAKEAAKEAEAKKLQERAQRKSEWQAADPVEKLKILLKRHWKFVVLIILILCMFLS